MATAVLQGKPVLILDMGRIMGLQRVRHRKGFQIFQMVVKSQIIHRKR